MALDNLRGGTKRVVEENTPLNNLRGGTKRVVIVDGGGGKSVPQYATMPTADASNADNIVQYKGETDATYTNGYFYKNVGTTTPSSASATQTVGATLSDIAVDVDTLEAFTGWTTDNSLQIFYTADGWSVDTTSLGVTYTGTPNVGDAITITYTAESTSYAWTQIDVQPAPSGLPDQTGQSGKFLTTDGTDASWGTINALQNTATYPTAGGLSTGLNSVASYNGQCTAYGYGAEATKARSVALGHQARSNGVGTIVVGRAKVDSDNTILLDATEGVGLVPLNDPHTMYVVINNGEYLKLLSADGTVPHARLTNAVVSNAVTIAAADWGGGTTCTKTISGLTATSVVWVAPDSASQSDYLTAGVYASAQTTDTITFTATTTPTNALVVNVIYC